MEKRIEKISTARAKEIIDYEHSATYNPGGNTNGKKKPSHPQAYLHGRKIAHTVEGSKSWDGSRNPHFTTGTDIDVGETAVVCTGYSYYETRCISKTINQRRYGMDCDSGLDSFYVTYKFRNVKKDGNLGKKIYWIYSEEVILKSEGDAKWGKTLPLNCTEI